MEKQYEWATNPLKLKRAISASASPTEKDIFEKYKSLGGKVLYELDIPESNLPVQEAEEITIAPVDIEASIEENPEENPEEKPVSKKRFTRKKLTSSK